MNFERALEIQKLMPHPGAHEFEWLAETVKDCQRIVEVGSFIGASTRAMLDNSNAHIWCIDSWCGGLDTSYGCVPTNKDYQLFLKHINDVRDRVTILKMYSNDAAGLLPDNCFDMVYIDADHSYNAVRFDILHYAPLVRPGGILCGHDYEEVRPGLIQAVKELITDPKKAGQMVWWTVKEKGWLREVPPSNLSNGSIYCISG